MARPQARVARHQILGEAMDHNSRWTQVVRQNVLRDLANAFYLTVRLIYSCSVRTAVGDDGTVTGFFSGASESGSTIHFQPVWPFLSMVQAPPPRLQISHRQWSLLAGMAKTNVKTAVIITPHSAPLRNKRLIFLFPTLSLYKRSKLGLKPVPPLGDIDEGGSLCTR